jgi:DNA-binding protein H-NS
MTEDQQKKIKTLQAERDKLQEKLDGIDQQIEAIRTEARAEVLKAVQQQAMEFNFTPAEILGLSEKKPRAKKAPKAEAQVALYRNDKGETWGGGKGRLPNWVKDLKKSGGDIEKYRITP